jgi:hypothetical protein
LYLSGPLLHRWTVPSAMMLLAPFERCPGRVSAVTARLCPLPWRPCLTSRCRLGRPAAWPCTTLQALLVALERRFCVGQCHLRGTASSSGGAAARLPRSTSPTWRRCPPWTSPRLSVVHFHTGGRAASLFVAGEYTPRHGCQAASRPYCQLTRQLRGVGVEDG